MKKRLEFCFIAITAFVLACFLVSCTNSERFRIVSIESKKMPEQKIKLRFISSWGGVDAKAETLQQILNRFMKDNSDIEVVNESIFGEDFLHKLKTDFASGYNPDVFGLWPGSDIRALVKAGKVAELTGILEKEKEWKDSFDRNNWEYTTFDGKIYGLPLEIIYECLFVNKELFDLYKVKVPETYEELKQAVRVFRQNNVIPIAYNSLSEGTYIYQNIVAGLGGKEGVETPFKNGKVSRCYIDAMDYVKELYEMGAFPDDYYRITSRERNDLFKTKKAAMIVQGSWFIGQVKDRADSIDIVPFPRIKGEKSEGYSLIYGFGCGAFYMSKTSWDDEKRREASIKLLKALTSRESAALLAERTGMLSNVDIGNVDDGQDVLKKKEKKLLENAAELIGPPDSFVDRSVWEGTIVKNFFYVLIGEKTPEAVWEEAMQEYEKLDVE